MARYPNGRIPKSRLTHLGGDHWLTPGTKVRWDRLVADVLKNEGVRLQITPGPNAYRDIGWQQHYWDTLPYPQASYPGSSSHGGNYKGRDSMAIDVGNWGLLGKAKFYAYARKHGFEPNYFDWEPWHIIDWTPWSVPAGGLTPTPPPVIKPEPIPEKEEDDMKVFGYIKSADKRKWYVQFNSTSGFWSEFVTNKSSYARSVAKIFGGGAPLLTEEHRNDLKAERDLLVERLTGSKPVD